MKGRKHERPLSVDLPFDEALRRFLRADPAEVKSAVEKEKRQRHDIGLDENNPSAPDR